MHVHYLNYNNYMCVPVFFLILAAQMWCLCRLLPLMIGHLIPNGNEHWENFLLLLKIIDIILAPCTTHRIISYLGVLIQDHHEEFFRLNPSCPVTPKFHYMIHYPEWMSR